MTTWTAPAEELRLCLKYHHGCQLRIAALREASQIDYHQRPPEDIGGLVLRGMFAMADATAFMRYQRVFLKPNHAKT